ncbi:MAG: arginine--tRNA ligase [Thermocrinis sp.]|nr:arginine--tRNA ligase [Thermocrinis sp.]
MKELIKEKLETLLREKYSIEGLNYTIEEPKDRHLGDLATNVCFLLSKHLKKPPHLLAEEIAKELSNEDFQAEPLRGFINFRFSEGRIKESFKELLSLASNYYFEDIGKGKRLQIEFVSANPTGPLHLGHGRGAVVGDALYRLLKAFGYDVVREYYINDAGYQVYLFGLSILYRVYELFGKEDQELKQKFEEEGYKGNYVKELAKDVKAFFGEEVLDWDREQAIEKLGEYGVKRMLEDIKETLAFMGVEFDLWVSEKSLHQRGLVEKVIKLLEEKGYTYTQDGALWFKSSSFGDDKDRVLVRSDGTPTYFAGDIAYHYYKYERGFEEVINLWGADHWGYLPRLKGAIKALGIPEDWLKVEFVQMVRLFSGGKEIRMSKRTGEFITLRELLEEVGVDAVRFIFLTKRSDTPLDFDIDLVKQNTAENPVFYVQYAHARVRGVFREVRQRFDIDPDKESLTEYISHMKDQQGLELMKKLLFFKDTLKDAVLNLSPHLIVYDLLEIAKLFHNYYNHHRVMVEDKSVMMGRLSLLKGVEIGLKVGLNLIGVNAPERM